MAELIYHFAARQSHLQQRDRAHAPSAAAMLASDTLRMTLSACA
jgi:hypothetical protein